MESVLLVGGSGFLGQHLIEAFWNVEPRPAIHVFDIRGLPARPEGSTVFTFDPAAITVHVGDLTDAKDVSDVLEKAKPSVVVHSASPIHGLGQAVYRKVNVDGTRVLVEQCTANPLIKALIYTSSAGVVFNGEDIYGVDERCPFPRVPMDAYNETKQQGEELALRANSPSLKTVALRPAGIFGPGDRQMIPSLRVMAERGQHRIQLGDNDNLFDVTYVGNIAYAHVLAAEKLLADAPDVSGEAFFITNDEPIYFWSLAKQIWKHDGYTIPEQWVIPKTLGVYLGYASQWACALIGKEPSFTAFRVRTACATRYYDISKAKLLLGYAPKWSLKSAIELTLDN